jgi:hypothetical protein
MPNQTFQVSPWAVVFLLITPIWFSLPACTGQEMQTQVEEDSEARTIKSRRKQRLRQQRCEKAESAKLQAVQSKLALERTRYSSSHPIVRDLAAQETKLTAALENCKN